MTLAREQRVDAVIDLLTRLAVGDYQARGTRDPADPALDAVVVGINMLAEELEAHRAELEDRVRARTAELEAARAVALEASRQKSQFLAMMSHEIRTPMNGVLGLTSLMLDTALDERQRRYADGVRSAGESLLAIINDILDFSKIEAGRLDLETTDLDLARLVEEAVDLSAEPARRGGLSLRFSCSPELPRILRGDPARLRQVLVNLVSNAVKFTERGEVVIRTHLVGRTLEGVMARVEVRDTGIGIDPATRDRLFQPFSQAEASTTRRFGGTGLGLAISRQLVAAMGGEIGVHSVPGDGSTFWFTVPLALADRLEVPDVEVPPSETLPDADGEERCASSTRGHVLVVEDDPVNQMVAVGMLEHLRYTVEVAGNGLEALTALERTAFDAVLMDCQMPEMDGYDATRAIRERERTARTPVIAMTAFATQGERERCLAAGMDDYLTKPVQRESLRVTLLHWAGTRGLDPHAAAGSPPARPAEPVVDPGRLKSLRDLGPELLQQVLAQYLASAPEQVELMVDAVRSGAPRDLADAAHHLRGSALSLGAERVAARCRDLEQIGAADELHLAGPALDRLVVEVEQAASALRARVPDPTT